MSIRAQFYITGDTQQSGFRRIGGTPSFPADALPLLNNGETIPEKARVVPFGTARQGIGGPQVLSHVWEYQTGRFGVPVVINTIVAIGTGRAHGFSEYVTGETDNVAELADVGRMIAGAENFDLLDVDTFMGIPGWDTVDCQDTDWVPAETDPYGAEGGIDAEDTWKKTLLTHYWKQASIRAFSDDPPTTVRVNLGEFSERVTEDIEATIKEAKRFFSSVIVPALPKQVQNIASMAAGVNCSDQCSLYAAVEFDISENGYEEETLYLSRPKDLRQYRLTQGELDFISEVCNGKTPEPVQKFFDHYKELIEEPELQESGVPFMADYRVWYALYCIDRIIKEKHAFIEKAGLMNEHGNPKKIRDARVCYLMMQNLRKLLDGDHQLNDKRRNLVTELTEELNISLMKVMLENMAEASAEPFLLRRNEMVDFHRRTLYIATDAQLDDMIALAVADARVSKTPQFVRCYPATPIRNEQADARNGKLLSALLPEIFTRRIEEEKKKENVEDKYLDQLRAEEFADNWACQSHCEKTKEAIANFLRKEISEDRLKHFLLYKISLKYIPENELLNITLNHFIANNTKQNMRPEERQLKIAAHGAREYISSAGNVDSVCVSSMNRYYQACFREYRGNIGAISEDIIRRLGGDTTEAMTLIFDEYRTGNPLNREEAEAVFDAFGGANKVYARKEAVVNAYTGMLSEQRTAMLSAREADRGRVIRWLGEMVAAAPFEIDTSGDMVALFNHATDGERMTSEEAENIFSLLDEEHKYAKAESVTTAFTSMIHSHQAEILQGETQDKESARENLITWVSNMVERAPFRVDTSDTIRALFESARTGERMSRGSAQEIFSRLMKYSTSGDEKVRPAFQTMIRDQLDIALKNKDDSVLDWIGGMISASDGAIDYDTTEILKKIFESAKDGERMLPADAASVFSAMKGKADGLDTTVQRTYNEMLSVRRKETVDNTDPDGFTWLCDMADRSPWAADSEWIKEQHTEDVIALCEISEKTGNSIDSVSLTTVQNWLDQGSITQKGTRELQKYCNTQLEKGNSGPADAMVRRFDRIDETCEQLRRSVFEGAVLSFLDGLKKPNVSFGDLINENSRNVEIAGKRLDELYNETKEESDEFIERHFANTSDLEILVSEQAQIPENCAFYRIWQDKLSNKVYEQQVDMFNQQPNLEKLKGLKASILKRSTTLQPSIEAAYSLLESYEGRLEKLKNRNEYEAVTTLGTELKEINNLLNRASDVRKTLCSSLRTVRYPVQEEIREMDFRHNLSVEIMQATLTDSSHEVQGKEGQKEGGCPDWKKVLDNLFPQAELDEAIRKPYAANNLGVLQRLLSTVENARIMAAYGMNDAWVADLVRTIHGHANLHKYQSALARNRKMSNKYNLQFGTDGLQFDVETP